jgi:hypothetical protein
LFSESSLLDLLMADAKKHFRGTSMKWIFILAIRETKETDCNAYQQFQPDSTGIAKGRTGHRHRPVLIYRPGRAPGAVRKPAGRSKPVDVGCAVLSAASAERAQFSRCGAEGTLYHGQQPDARDQYATQTGKREQRHQPEPEYEYQHQHQHQYQYQQEYQSQQLQQRGAQPRKQL